MNKMALPQGGVITAGAVEQAVGSAVAEDSGLPPAWGAQAFHTGTSRPREGGVYARYLPGQGVYFAYFDEGRQLWLKNYRSRDEAVTCAAIYRRGVPEEDRQAGFVSEHQHLPWAPAPLAALSARPAQEEGSTARSLALAMLRIQRDPAGRPCLLSASQSRMRHFLKMVRSFTQGTPPESEQSVR